MAMHAKGSFDVKITPQPSPGEDPGLGKLVVEKTFRGDLEGSGRGDMLTAGTAVKTSAGYVVIERVTGTLAGKSGSFILQHSGIMNRGAPQLSITIVPDSGTGELAGIAGSLAIEIVDGEHLYDLEYTLTG
jgi:hypothetical protein